MLSFGWPEMLIVAAAALIIVGPRDLPKLLRNIGRVLGKIRRMGDEFKREINKVAAIDDIKEIKSSITNPLEQTRSDIESEFNKITIDGVEPSGAIKPKDPSADNVYAEIKAASAKVSEVKDGANKADKARGVSGSTSNIGKKANNSVSNDVAGTRGKNAKMAKNKTSKAKMVKAVGNAQAKTSDNSETGSNSKT